MASKLYGKVTGDAKTSATRGASREIEVWAQTERGRVSITMWASGDWEVTVNRVESLEAVGPDIVIAGGNVNTGDIKH